MTGLFKQSVSVRSHSSDQQDGLRKIKAFIFPPKINWSQKMCQYMKEWDDVFRSSWGLQGVELLLSEKQDTQDVTKDKNTQTRQSNAVVWSTWSTIGLVYSLLILFSSSHCPQNGRLGRRSVLMPNTTHIEGFVLRFVCQSNRLNLIGFPPVGQHCHRWVRFYQRRHEHLLDRTRLLIFVCINVWWV